MIRQKQDNSLRGRQYRASSTIEDALSTFVDVAERLEAAAVEQEAVISDANDEINDLIAIQAAARVKADKATGAASKIRELVS